MIVLDGEFLHGISLRLEPFVDVPPRGPATPCALPDTGDFLKAIAALLRPIIHQEVKEAVGATKICSASFAIPADRNSYHRHRSFDEQRNVSRQKIYGNVRFGAPDQKRKGAVYQRFIYGVALSKSLQRLP